MRCTDCDRPLVTGYSFKGTHRCDACHEDSVRRDVRKTLHEQAACRGFNSKGDLGPRTLVYRDGRLRPLSMGGGI